jgi:membrane protein DedA with SNARE-associated domain
MIAGLHDLDVQGLIAGYGAPAVGIVVALESLGLPLPGETALIAAALYAGSTASLDIGTVIGAAALGAVIGDNIGYAIGRRFGSPLLRRFGPRLGLSDDRIRLGRYLFLVHGGKVVFLGRFVAWLRALAAVLAGINHMPWGRFLVFNAMGGILWANLIGLSAYWFGQAVEGLSKSVGALLVGLAVVLAVALAVWLARAGDRLQREANAALPGPLD